MADKPKKREFFQMEVDDEFRSQLTEVCKREPDYPSRAEMVRRLVRRAFNEKGKKR